MDKKNNKFLKKQLKIKKREERKAYLEEVKHSIREKKRFSEKRKISDKVNSIYESEKTKNFLASTINYFRYVFFGVYNFCHKLSLNLSFRIVAIIFVILALISSFSYYGVNSIIKIWSTSTHWDVSVSSSSERLVYSYDINTLINKYNDETYKTESRDDYISSLSSSVVNDVKSQLSFILANDMNLKDPDNDNKPYSINDLSVSNVSGESRIYVQGPVKLVEAIRDFQTKYLLGSANATISITDQYGRPIVGGELLNPTETKTSASDFSQDDTGHSGSYNMIAYNGSFNTKNEKSGLDNISVTDVLGGPTQSGSIIGMGKYYGKELTGICFSSASAKADSNNKRIMDYTFQIGDTDFFDAITQYLYISIFNNRYNVDSTWANKNTYQRDKIYQPSDAQTTNNNYISSFIDSTYVLFWINKDQLFHSGIKYTAPSGSDTAGKLQYYFNWNTSTPEGAALKAAADIQKTTPFIDNTSDYFSANASISKSPITEKSQNNYNWINFDYYSDSGFTTLVTDKLVNLLDLGFNYGLPTPQSNKFDFSQSNTLYSSSDDKKNNNAFFQTKNTWYTGQQNNYYFSPKLTTYVDATKSSDQDPIYTNSKNNLPLNPLFNSPRIFSTSGTTTTTFTLSFMQNSASKASSLYDNQVIGSWNTNEHYYKPWLSESNKYNPSSVAGSDINQGNFGLLCIQEINDRSSTALSSISNSNGTATYKDPADKQRSLTIYISNNWTCTVLDHFESDGQTVPTDAYDADKDPKYLSISDFSTMYLNHSVTANLLPGDPGGFFIPSSGDYKVLAVILIVCLTVLYLINLVYLTKRYSFFGLFGSLLLFFFIISFFYIILSTTAVISAILFVLLIFGMVMFNFTLDEKIKQSYLSYKQYKETGNMKLLQKTSWKSFLSYINIFFVLYFSCFLIYNIGSNSVGDSIKGTMWILILLIICLFFLVEFLFRYFVLTILMSKKHSAKVDNIVMKYSNKQSNKYASDNLQDYLVSPKISNTKISKDKHEKKV